MSADPADLIGKDAPKIEPPHPSNPIMRRPRPTSKRSTSPVQRHQPDAELPWKGIGMA